jgi:hypothetical protein
MTAVRVTLRVQGHPAWSRGLPGAHTGFAPERNNCRTATFDRDALDRAFAFG